MIYAAFIAFCCVVFLLVAALAFREWLADKWADYASRSPELSAPDALRAIPEPTWDQPADLPRARLRSVPVNGRHLAAVPNEDDDLWAGYFDERPAPFTVPVQRKASE